MTLRAAALLVLTAVVATACDKTDPCADLVDAIAKCYKDGGVELPAGYDYDSQCAPGAVYSEAFYTCGTDAYDAGDCSTEDGTKAIATAFEACGG